MEVRRVKAEEALRYEELSCLAFHYREEKLADREKAEQWAKECDEKNFPRGIHKNIMERVCAFQNGQIVAGMKINPYTVRFDGDDCDMAGIGAVLSDPEIRKSGTIRAIFPVAFALMREHGQYLSHLYPFSAYFYRKFGYEALTGKVTWKIPVEYLPKADNKGIVCYRGTQEQKEDIKNVYLAFMSNFNMSVVRDENGWEKYFESRVPYASDFYSYLHYDEEGKPDGFFSYQLQYEGDTPFILSAGGGFYFSTAEGLRALLAFGATYGSYASRLDLVLPREINISCLLNELTGGFGKKEIQKEQTAMSGMSRVIDVEEILKMARYLGKGRAVIEIKDEQCPWNQDVFRVEFDGRATSVSRTGECPDAVMGIGIFSALILGVYQFEQIRFLPQVVIYGNEENLRKIFYQKACWIEEGF